MGDVHGSEHHILNGLTTFHKKSIDTIIQVGDLGVWPGRGAAESWDRVEAALAANGQTMFVAPGNHEDYDQIDALVPRADGWLPFRDHILLAPRGHRSELGGRSVVWLGGAGSVDRGARIADDRIANHVKSRYGSSSRQKTWWSQEEITDADVERTIAGGGADIMVCHDAPRPVKTIEDYVESAASGFSAIDVEYAAVSRGRLTEAVKEVAPQLLLHGHWHFNVDDIFKVPFQEHVVRIVGLHRQGHHGNLAVLDTATLDVEIAPGARRHPGASVRA